MNAAATYLLAAAVLVAVIDWLAVARGTRTVEYVCKPGTLLLLVACALALQPTSPPERAWFVAALLLGAAGDVLLMLPRDLFLPGLLAFLLGHLAYIAGFISTGPSGPRAGLAAVLVAIALVSILPRVLRGVTRETPALAAAVVAYAVVIGGMVVAAFASRQPVAVVPALLFLGSDTLIAFRRFVAPRPWMPVAITVTYHLAQAGLVLSLVRA